MPDITIASADTMLGAQLVAGVNYYMSLHTADPLTTGGSEITGGSYARQLIVFAAAANSTVISTDAQAFSGLSGPPALTNFGIWTALTGGTYKCGGVLGTVASPTTITTTAISFLTGAVSFLQE